MELEGTLLVDRAPTRRWVSIVGIVVPVAIVALVTGWFVRSFIAPPTIAFPSSMQMAAAPSRTQIDAPAPPPAAMIERGFQQSTAKSPARPTPTTSEPPPALPMVATLAVAPPTLSPPAAQPAPLPVTNGSRMATTAAPAPMAGPAPAPMSEPTPVIIESAEMVAPSEPINGAFPLPKAKPHSAARLASAVPLPRPKPSDEGEASQAVDLPGYDRHGLQ